MPTTDAIVIRLEQPADAEQIRELNDQAFGTTTESRLVDALRGAPGSVSLVATRDGHVIGHILFTEVTIEPPTTRRVAGLGPMSVRPGYQRAGIGGHLVYAGLTECRRLGYQAVVVVGHPEYYPRFGFVPAHTMGLACEFSVPAPVFMVLELETSALAGTSGVVRYHPAFGEA